MEEFLDFILLFLNQFAGGPGPVENNLVRFALPAALWAVLLYVAWSRQRSQDLPRERLLVWGFGLALARELVMFTSASIHVLNQAAHDTMCIVLEPVEHALGLASVVVIAGSFLRYVLDDADVTRRYLRAGLVAAGVGFLITIMWWPGQKLAAPGIRFHHTWPAWLVHMLATTFIVIAAFVLMRKRGWLRNVVLLAFSFLFLSEVLLMLNFFTGWRYTEVFCRIGNSFHILAVPLFGYVYSREQTIEKRQAEDELRAYRDQLEDLVGERTTELTEANEQLQREIQERWQAQAETARRNAELAAQNAIAATISRSLDLDIILGAAMDTALAVLEMESGCLYLLDPDDGSLERKVAQGRTYAGLATDDEWQQRVCQDTASRAVTDLAPVLVNVLAPPDRRRTDSTGEHGRQLLVSIPLISHGQAVGALALTAQQVDEITAQEIELLTAIGQQIGMAVENAWLYRETQRWAGSMALFHEVSVFLSSTFDSIEIYDQIAQQSARLIDCPAAHLFLWEEGDREAVRVAGYGVEGLGASGLRLRVSESSILTELLTQPQPIVAENAAEDSRIPASWRESLEPQSLLCLPVRGGSGEPLGFLLMLDPYKARRWRSHDVDLLKNFVNRAAVALENAHLHKQLEWAAALEERQRLAAEMHDGLAQTLSYLGLKADRATELVEAGQVQQLPEELEQMQDALRQATREVRHSIASLQDSPRPRQSLQATLMQFIGEFIQGDGSPVDVQDRLEAPIFLPAGDLEQVSRVVQEALVNARRHAEARQITVFLEQVGEYLEVVVADDGQGFDLERAAKDSDDHFGLSIMRARAARIEGELLIESEPGQGTRVRLIWPLIPGRENLVGVRDQRTPDEEPMS